ncbi:hypothetical protein BE11_13705 [Sorangium cellulosum]|nr:hypothetical protein BE11_13705 [Sorangium cellulosum]
MQPSFDEVYRSSHAYVLRLLWRVRGRRPIFILHDLEGMAMRELAQAFEISQNTAWDRLRRARDELAAAARRLDARDRHALGRRGLRVLLAPLLLPPGPPLPDRGADTLDVSDASAAPLWARIQASLASGITGEPTRRGLRAPPSGPRGDVADTAMTTPPGHTSLVLTGSWTKHAVAGAAMFLAGAAAATAAIGALGAQLSSPALEIRREETAAGPLASTIAAPLGASSTDGSTAMPPPATAMSAPATAMPPPATAMPTRSPAARRAAQATAGESGGHDIALLGRADAALGAGRPAEALALLERHARKYTHGPGTEQREALAVRALVAAGRRDEAAGRAERFRAAFPGSLLAPTLDADVRPR